MLSLCPVDRGSHLPRLHGHFHHDVCPTLGQGFRVAIQGLDNLDRKALQGGYDRAERGSAKEGGYGHMLPQRKLGSLERGGAEAKGAATAKGNPSPWGTY
jgi:hypothetical protein